MTTFKTVDQIDAAMLLLPASPVTGEDIEARATLMKRRCELDQAERAPAPRKEPPTGFTIVVPPNMGLSDIIDTASGRTYKARILDGKLVVDATPQIFKMLLAGAHGKDWEQANQGSYIWDRLNPGSFVN
jgi:hypothetical protein